MWPDLGPIKTYTPLYLASIAAHFALAFFFARRLRLKWYVPLIVGTSYLLGMTVGAKVLFDVQRGVFTWAGLFSREHFMQGGLWGGPLAYLALAVPLALLLSRDRRAGLDLTALALPVPLAIAKVACLCNGCCYGKPTGAAWALTFPEGGVAKPVGVPLHPTQIYEILVLTLAAILLVRLNRPRWRGMLLFWFLGVYGIGRPVTEMFRGDLVDQPFWGPLTRCQWLCAAAGLVSIGVVLAYRHRAGRETPPPSVAVGVDEKGRWVD